MIEEGGANTYIQARGEAIATIESTISELSGIFTQLAQLVSEQGEQITRIDDNVEDVVGNAEGAQRELLKYWGRVRESVACREVFCGASSVFLIMGAYCRVNQPLVERVVNRRSRLFLV